MLFDKASLLLSVVFSIVNRAIERLAICNGDFAGRSGYIRDPVSIRALAKTPVPTRIPPTTASKAIAAMMIMRNNGIAAFVLLLSAVRTFRQGQNLCYLG